MRTLNSAVCEALESRHLLAADLTASIVTTLPAIIPLAGNVVTVNVTNIGDTPAIGTVETGLVFRNVDMPLQFTMLTPAHTARKIKLAPGASFPIVLKFNVPTSLVEGTYTLTAKADIGEALVEVDETNNESAGVTTDIRAPFVDLSGTVGTLAIKPVKLGKRGGSTVVPMTLLNTGNVPLKGNSAVNFFVSTDSTIGNGDDIAAGSGLLKGLNLVPNKTKVIKRPAKLPATLASGNYFVAIALDPLNSIVESDDANNSAISAATISVTNTAAPTGIAKITLDGVEITDGQLGAVNLGSVLQGLAGPTTTFTMTNLGTNPLTLGAISVPAGFVLDDGLAGSLAPGEFDTFTVSVDTAAVGTKSGSISVVTGDPKRNPYNFKVAASVTAATTPTLDAQLQLGATAFVVGQPDQIRFTATVAGTQSTVAVEVVETDSAGVILHKVVDLADDGSGLNDDGVAGDGVFNNSTAIVFDAPGDRFFVARFPDNSQKTTVAKLSGVNAPTSEQLQQILDNNFVQKDGVVQDIVAGKSDSQVVQSLKNRLLTLPDLAVLDSITVDQTSVSWTSPLGIRCAIDVASVREDLSATTLSEVSLGVESGQPQESLLPASAGPVASHSDVVALADETMQQCKQATILSPYAWKLGSGGDSSNTFVSDLSSKDWNIVSHQNFTQASQAVQVSDFRQLSQSKMIVINSKVKKDEHFGWAIFTGENESVSGDIAYLPDLISGRLMIWNLGYAIGRRFIGHYNSSFKDAIVYVEADDSARDDSLATPFIARGATYLGYTRDVFPTKRATVGKQISKTLIADKTVGEIPSLNTIVEPASNGQLVRFGSDDAKLHDHCSVIGNLEVIVRYTWEQGQEDLDTGTTFLGETVGFGAPEPRYDKPYLSSDTRDNTGSGGSETVTVSIGGAYTASKWSGSVTIQCAAGWYELAGGSGPARLVVLLRDAVTGEEIDSLSKQISPGKQDGLATTSVGTITITASGQSTDATATMTLA